MPKFKDLTGKEFNGIKALRCVGRDKHGNALWLFRCRCGEEFITSGHNVVSGNTKSCGCYEKLIFEQKRNKYIYKHGQAKRGRKTKLYRIWCCMKRRCYSKNGDNYKYYGGRGINVYKDWKDDYLNFYSWAINNGYKNGLTIDRIDVNGDYCPENCRWITKKEQGWNKRNNLKIFYRGEILNTKEISQKTGLDISTVRYRIKHNIDIDKPLKVYKWGKK